MFGHEWQKVTGTVARARITAIGKGQYGNDIRHEYQVDLQPGDGPARRVTVADPHIMTADWLPPQQGDEVTLEISADGEVRFDKSDPRRSRHKFARMRKREGH